MYFFRNRERDGNNRDHVLLQERDAYHRQNGKEKNGKL